MKNKNILSGEWMNLSSRSFSTWFYPLTHIFHHHGENQGPADAAWSCDHPSLSSHEPSLTQGELGHLQVVGPGLFDGRRERIEHSREERGPSGPARDRGRHSCPTVCLIWDTAPCLPGAITRPRRLASRQSGLPGRPRRPLAGSLLTCPASREAVTGVCSSPQP